MNEQIKSVRVERRAGSARCHHAPVAKFPPQRGMTFVVGWYECTDCGALLEKLLSTGQYRKARLRSTIAHARRAMASRTPCSA